jgi:hypothetical protein
MEPVLFEGAKQQGEEAFTAVVVMLPGILAVENHGQEPVLQRNVVREAADSPEHIVGGRLRGRLVIDEAEGIGNIPVAEHHGERLLRGADCVGLIEMIMTIPGLVGHLERPVEDTFVRRQPADPGFAQDGQQLRTDRSFRGPEPGRCTAERVRVVVDCPPHLGFGIGRSMESSGQRQVRSGAASEFRVDHERKNRVEKRRGGQFDLPTLLERRIHRDNLPDCGLLQRQHFLLVLFRKSPILRAQLRQTWKALQAAVSEPGEIVPDLEVQKFLRRKLSGQTIEVLPLDVDATFHQQFLIAGKGPYHGGPIGGKEMADQEGFFSRGQLSRRALRIFQEEIADAAGGELFQLQQQRRREVKGRASLRKSLQQEGHVEVGLGGVQTHPGHTRGPRERVRVIRLMHMPEEAELNGFHREVSCRLQGSMS